MVTRCVCDVENSLEHNQTSREGTLVILKSLQMFTDIQTVQLETVSSGLSTNIKHQTPCGFMLNLHSKHDSLMHRTQLRFSVTLYVGEKELVISY